MTKLGLLNVGDSFMSGANCGATETRIYPYCLCGLFGSHSLWRNTLLSLNTVVRALVQPQSNVLDFGNSPWEALPSLRSEWGTDGEKEERMGGVEEVGTGIGM